jgi:hypothetical protein
MFGHKWTHTRDHCERERSAETNTPSLETVNGKPMLIRYFCNVSRGTAQLPAAVSGTVGSARGDVGGTRAEVSLGRWSRPRARLAPQLSPTRTARWQCNSGSRGDDASRVPRSEVGPRPQTVRGKPQQGVEIEARSGASRRRLVSSAPIYRESHPALQARWGSPELGSGSEFAKEFDHQENFSA